MAEDVCSELGQGETYVKDLQSAHTTSALTRIRVRETASSLPSAQTPTRPKRCRPP